MKKTVKILAAFLLSAITVFSFAACKDYKRGGEIERVEYTVDMNLEYGTQISISVIRPDREAERKMLDAAILGFNEKYPFIEVKQNTLTINTYNETMVKQSRAKNLADIIWTDSAKYYFLISNDIALNLDPFFEQGKTGEFAFNYEKDFTTDFKNMGKYGDLHFALPRSADSVVTFYNTEILTAAGVDLNPETTVIKNGWSWSDFLSVCQKVREYYDSRNLTNYYPIDANLDWESVAWPIIKSFGGEILGNDGKFALTEEANKKVTDLVGELVEKRYVHKVNDSASNFETGTGAMLFQSAAIDNYQNTQGTRDKFDVVSFPLINGENSNIGYGFAGYALNAQLVKDPDVKNQDKLNAACLFLSYLMSESGQQKLARDGGLSLPSIRNDLSRSNPDAEWHKTYADKFNVDAYTFGSQYKTELDFLGKSNPEFSAGLVKALNKYVGKYAKEETAAKAFEYFREDVKDVFDSVVK